jgi:hypothetical protein
MKRSLLLCGLLLLCCFLLGIGAARETSFPTGARLEVHLELDRHFDKGDEARVSGLLKISNSSGEDLLVQHPQNRLVLAFLVTDSLGNVVAPRGIAKVDPFARTQVLKGGEAYSYQFDHLWFVTGSARFGYQLDREQSYKVIAVYRPAGPTGPGFTSSEVRLEAQP